MKNTKPIVLKFGGTSVGTPEAIRKVIRILHPIRTLCPVAVVSAFSGVTDNLVRLADSSNPLEAKKIIHDLTDRHLSTFAQLLPDHEPSDALEGLLRELAAVEGVLTTGPATLKTRDYILSFGERLSATIIAYYCNAIGIRSTLLDARSVIRTDSQFGQAAIHIEETYRLIREHFSSSPELHITTGFIGTDDLGQTTTLGRGGSDLTASLFGGALQAEEIQIWTDVSGIYSADPRCFPTALHFEQLKYDDALALALAGAKVIHPAAIYPARDKKIPVRIKNTFFPEDAGTLIADDTPAESRILSAA